MSVDSYLASSIKLADEGRKWGTENRGLGVSHKTEIKA